MKQGVGAALIKKLSKIINKEFRSAIVSVKKSLAFLFVLILNWTVSYSQIPPISVGSWRTHFSFFQIKSIVETDKYVYAASNNGLFRINLQNKSKDIISKIQGLSESNIAILSYHEELNVLIIAYQDGNLDIVDSEGYIKNIADISNSNSITGNKNVNHIFNYGDFAFLSCDFGLVKLNVKKLEIAEDYRNLSQTDVSQISIISSIIDDNSDSIYLSTSQGLLSAPYNETINLQDVNNWSFIDTLRGIPIKNLGNLVNIDNALLLSNNFQGRPELFKFTGNNWDTIPLNFSNPIVKIRKMGEKMILISGNQIQIWANSTSPETVLTNLDVYPKPNDFIIDSKGKYWISSPERGLLSNLNGQYENIVPNGPYGDLAVRMTYYDNKIVATSGGRQVNFTQRLNDQGYYIFENNTWTNYLPKKIPETKYIGNYVLDMYEPYYYKSGSFLAIGSIGYGILAQYSEDSFSVFNKNNSTLFNILDGFASTRVSALKEDQNGNLIAINTQSPTPINIYNPDEGWRVLNLNTQNLDRVDEIVIDGANNVWCRVINISGGIIVFNEEDNKIITLGTTEGRGNLPNNTVNAIAKDKNGEIWVGTNDGIAVFFNPERVFDASGIDAATPIFENRPLLREEFVTAIEVDAANRKWIGTNNGVWLFSPDGTDIIANFKTDNSPLLSNQIVDIEINDLTGEVFFATTSGIISYRGTAIEQENICDDIKVFPNPVKPGYNGMLTAYGLPENANVKFTDINGNLFYETLANGNSVSWNLKDYNGRKGKTGMYLLLSSDQDGEETCVTKFAIVE